MIDENEIKKNYANFSKEKLLKLTNELPELNPKAVLILQKELIKRGYTAESMKISEFLIKGKQNDFDPYEYIKSELEAGESKEDIQFRLHNMGINMFDILRKNQLKEDFVLDYIATQKYKNLPDKELELDLKKNFNIDSQTKKILESKLKKQARKNYTIGGIVVVIAFILVIINLTTRGSISIVSILLLSTGLWRIYEGNKLS